MYRSKAFIIFFLLVANLFSNTPNLEQNKTEQSGDESSFVDYIQKRKDEKKRAEQDFDILAALELKYKDPKSSLKIFEKLYKSTNSDIYIKEILEISYAIKDFQTFEKYIDIGQKTLSENEDFIKQYIGFLATKQNYEEAKKYSEKLIKVNRNWQNLAIHGVVLYDAGEYNGALKSFKESYELDKSDENLLRIVDVLLNKLNKKQEAIIYLESHRKFFGCSDGGICNVLIEIYTRDNNFKEAMKINIEQYEKTGNTGYLDNVLSYYFLEKKYDKIIEISKKYNYNLENLIPIYALNNDYDSAIKWLKSEFEKTNNFKFLIDSFILEYEKATKGQTKKIDKKTLNEIIANFDKISDKLETAEHLNYYGYLLIDHDVDIKKGLKFVEKALEQNATSPYYLDSLAWGYFKLNECKKAKETMEKIVADDEFWNNDEAKEHIKDIDKCFNLEINAVKQ